MIAIYQQVGIYLCIKNRTSFYSLMFCTHLQSLFVIPTFDLHHATAKPLLGCR